MKLCRVSRLHNKKRVLHVKLRAHAPEIIMLISGCCQLTGTKNIFPATPSIIQSVAAIASLHKNGYCIEVHVMQSITITSLLLLHFCLACVRMKDCE